MTEVNLFMRYLSHELINQFKGEIVSVVKIATGAGVAQKKQRHPNIQP